MMKLATSAGLVLFLCVSVVGCSAAPDGESADRVDDAVTINTTNPIAYNQWICTLRYGSSAAPLDGPLNVSSTPPPSPYDPKDPYPGLFYLMATGAGSGIGEARPNYHSVPQIYNWFSIKLLGLNQAQMDKLITLVENGYWSRPDVAVYPGIFHCEFDVGECESFGGDPGKCKAPHVPLDILAYDPNCVKAKCDPNSI